MLTIDKQSIREDITAIKGKLANPEKKEECIAEIEHMIEVKQSHIWRTEGMASCCGSVCNLASSFETEIGMLQSAVNATKENDSQKATALLEDYFAFLDKNYADERPNYQ